MPPPICTVNEGEEDEEIFKLSSFFPPSLPERRPTEADLVAVRLWETGLAVILNEEEEEEAEGEVTSETVLGFDVSRVTLAAGLETPPGSLTFGVVVEVVVVVEPGFW